jgi:hypothetical protein
MKETVRTIAASLSVALQIATLLILLFRRH